MRFGNVGKCMGWRIEISGVFSVSGRRFVLDLWIEEFGLFCLEFVLCG